MSNRTFALVVSFILPISIISPAMASGYIGLGSGKSKIEGSRSDGVDDLRATSKKIFGGYRFSGFGIEAGYHDFGDLEFGLTKYDFTALELSAMGYYSATPSFEFFGKLGILAWDSKTSIETPITTSTVKDSGNDAIIGIGAQFNPLPSLILRAEAQKAELGKADTTLLTFGVGYKF